MPGWGDILNEITDQKNQLLKADPTTNPNTAQSLAIDFVRKKYLAALSAYTKNNTIVYASAFLQKSQLPPDRVVLNAADLDGFLAAVKRCDRTKGLDLILHSPGGSPEAAEQIVSYLRQKFDSIRVIVPHMAMSAATMLACAADEIVMARHSTLGPTDPQMIIRTNAGEVRMVAAHALISDFEEATEAAQSKDGSLNAWVPILAQYPPGLIAQCDMAIQLTKKLVNTWLRTYMFKKEKNKTLRAQKSRKAASFLSSPDHLTHGRPLMRDALREKGLNIVDLETDNNFQDLVMSLYHACTHSLGGTTMTKIIENHLGDSYLMVFQPK